MIYDNWSGHMANDSWFMMALWLVLLIDLVLVGIWLAKQINR